MKKTSLLTLALLAIFMIGVSCSSEPGTSETPDKDPLEGNDYLITIRTDFGEMKAILFDETPKHKENFLKLVQEKFYDSLLFHRVIQGFMIQGGDPNSRSAGPQDPLGSGGPGYRIPAEFVANRFHEKGTLAAARTGGPGNPELESSGSQFYIVQGQTYPKELLEEQMLFGAANGIISMDPENDISKACVAAFNENGQEGFRDKVLELKDDISNAMVLDKRIEAYSTIGGTPSLDYQYTVFGKVISGIEVLDAIAATATAPGDRPIEDARMYMTVEEISRKEINEQFGYDFL